MRKASDTKSFSSLWRRELLLPSLFLALVLALPFRPEKGLFPTAFDRQIGAALASGIDVSKRVSHFYINSFLLLPLLFVAVYALARLLWGAPRKRAGLPAGLINMCSLLGLVSLVFVYYTRHKSETPIPAVVLLSAGLVGSCLLFVFLKRRNAAISLKKLLWCLCLALPLLLCLDALMALLQHRLALKLLLVLYFLLAWAIFAIFSPIRLPLPALAKCFLPAMAAPILCSALLEGSHLLNQRGVIVPSNAGLVLLGYLASFALCLCLLGCAFRRPLAPAARFQFEKWYFPLLILSLALLWVQPAMEMTIPPDLFEGANDGTGVSNFFFFGKLPMLESFDAHMLYSQVGKFLYGLFSGDYAGAVLYGYSLTPIFILLYYFLFSAVLGRRTALLLVLLFPVANEFSFTFSCGFLVVLGLLYALRKKNWRGYLAYWCSVAAVTLLLLDVGFAFASSSLLTWALLFALYPDRVDIKKLLLSGAGLLGAGLAVYTALCLAKGIAPMDRLREFLGLALSNTNWALAALSHGGGPMYALVYLILPAAAAGLTAVLIGKLFKRRRLGQPPAGPVLCLMLGLAFIFNFSRTLVRHTLAEPYAAGIHLSVMPLFLGLCAYLLIKSSKARRLMAFLGVEMAFFILWATGPSPMNLSPSALPDLAIRNCLSPAYYKDFSETVRRVRTNKEVENLTERMQMVWSAVLENEETYLDFTNMTLLYALNQREKPVYVNQSPGLLSGEYTQQQFIAQIEAVAGRVPFALMRTYPANNYYTDIDDIPNEYRYYLVSEYISQHYTPLFATADFSFWCRNERWEEKAALAQGAMEAGALESAWLPGVGVEEGQYVYTLGHLPFLWANYDKIPLEQKEVQLRLAPLQAQDDLAAQEDGTLYPLDIAALDKGSGNYLSLCARAHTGDTLEVELGEWEDGYFTPGAQFNFNLEEGEQVNYLLRISSCPLWYQGSPNAVRIFSPQGANVQQIEVRKGDTLKP